MVSSFQTFNLFEKVAQEPINNVNFPSHFEIVLKLKTVLSDPSSSIRRVVDILHGEPLIATKVISSANSVAVRGYDQIVDLERAVSRLGIDQVRRLSLITAINQLRESRHVLQYASLGRRVWLRSLYVAAAAYVIADETTDIPGPEAQFAGLLLKIGAFYLLHRLGTIPELVLHPDDVKEGLSRHYLPVGRNVLEHLGLPRTVRQAMEIEVYQKQPLRHPPKTLAEVLNVANLFANDKISWYAEDANAVEILDQYKVLLPRIEEQFTKMQNEYR